jgi:hypothetical protein
MTALDEQSPLKDKSRAGHFPRFFILSVVFKAFDDSVTLDSDLGVKLGGLLILTKNCRSRERRYFAGLKACRTTARPE